MSFRFGGNRKVALLQEQHKLEIEALKAQIAELTAIAEDAKDGRIKKATKEKAKKLTEKK